MRSHTNSPHIIIYLFDFFSLTGGTYHSANQESSAEQTANGLERARVVCDYDAKDSNELTLMQDEVTKFEI